MLQRGRGNFFPRLTRVPFDHVKRHGQLGAALLKAEDIQEFRIEAILSFATSVVVTAYLSIVTLKLNICIYNTVLVDVF